MRLSQIEITNFRGVRQANLTALEDSPLVTISGRNGVGKSLILFAIFAAWRGDLGDTTAAHLVGPWGTECRVSIKFTLSPPEWAELVAFGERIGKPVHAEPQVIELWLAANDLDEISAGSSDSAGGDAGLILRDKRFRDQHSFAHLDLIPAERQITRQDAASPDPQALSEHQAEQLRESVLSSLIQQYGAFSLWGIQPYLSSLDYAEFLESRSGDVPTLQGDFDAIADGFAAATGKVLERPQLSADGQIAMFVDAGGGNRHSMSSLSSGEQEAIGLMYLVRRLASRGGILLIDEPEQHLHPSLQRVLVALLRQSGSHSQLWLSTHSPSLILTSSLDSLVSVHSSASHPDNQTERLTLEAERIELLAELGLSANAWQQSDYLMVVEGSTDESYLSRLLPLELGRAKVLVAGNASGVMQVSKALAGRDSTIAWLAIRDRDLADPEEVASWLEGAPNLFVWPHRTIENVFLAPAWIAATLLRSGREISADDIERRLEELSQSQRGDVQRLLIERQLMVRFKPAVESKKDLRAWYDAQVLVLTKRIQSLESISLEVTAEIERSWPSRWKEWVQAKRLLAEYLSDTPFRTLEHMLDAMLACAADDRSLLPICVSDLQARLRSL